RAIKQGFIQFFDNIATHLLNGVVGWLMGELSDAGIPTLSDFSLQGVIGWILEVLGISMERIWEKLAEHPRVGPERVAMIRGAIDTLDGIWTFIQDVRERGMAAIWDRIQEQLTNLWDTVLDAVKNWIVEQIVRNVVTRLLSMLDPTGIMAVVNSAIAFYNAIQSFIRYLTEMLQVVNTFVEGILQLASGSIGPAADALEGALDQAMPIVIGFLANQVGLGGVGRRVGEMIERAREMVDQALTWLVNRAVDTGMNIIDRLMGRGPAGGAEPEAEEEAAAEGVPGEAAAHSAITSLAVLDEPPVELPRDAQQKEQDLADATAVLRLATVASETTEDLDDFFPRIQRRFHLTSIGYVAQGEDGLGVGLVINPTRNEPIDRLRPKGTGIAGFETSIHHHTARLNGHDVGIRMDALLGPDHPQGTAPESG
ncbi:MAG TPA: hypothetical protein VN764_02995, partial [Polyangiaceae bacterium]|nr:hypothetical protein [Polyangiaceae bacterium]